MAKATRDAGLPAKRVKIHKRTKTVKTSPRAARPKAYRGQGRP